MRFLGVLAFAVSAALLAGAPAASATTVNFATSHGSAMNDYDPVTHIGAGGSSLDFDTVDTFGTGAVTQSAFVDYWDEPNYSQAKALFSATNGQVFQMTMTAGPGRVFTSLDLQLGGFSNASLAGRYDIYDGNGNLLTSDPAFVTDGTNGNLISLSGLNTSEIRFQLGTNWNLGINAVSFTTVAQTPIPGALILFGTALAGLGGIARRRRASAA